MSQPEIEISKRCSSCGASARDSAHFCPQCGISIMRDETQPLSEIKVEIVAEDSEKALEENVNEDVSSETSATVPLDAQQVALINENEEKLIDSENNSTIENQTDAGILWTDFDQNEYEDETSSTVALPSDTVPLVELQQQKAHQSESRIEEVKEIDLEEQPIEVNALSEDFADENKLGAKEKSQELVERTRKRKFRVKRMVVKSQHALDKASPDPSLRFVVISIALFLLVLFIFILSRYLK